LPLRPQHGDVTLDLQTVAEEIARGQAVAFVYVVVALDNEVVVPIVIGKSEV